MLKELLNQKAAIEQSIADLQATIEPKVAEMRDQIADINLQIGNITLDRLAQLRALQAKDYGVVNLVLDGIKVAQTIAKKVTWDQEKLNDLFDRIATAGDDPRAYMKMELKVGEKEYDKFPVEVKSLFAEARTVTPGPASVKYEEVPDA